MLYMDSMNIVLYVQDLERSKNFYELLLNVASADEPGNTEFPLTESTNLSLVPIEGLQRFLPQEHFAPAAALKAELYLFVDDPSRYLQQAEALGGRIVAQPEFKPWGHKVGYCVDPDGYMLAFASKCCVEG